MRSNATAFAASLVAVLLVAQAPGGALSCSGAAAVSVSAEPTSPAMAQADDALTRDGMIQYFESLGGSMRYRENVRSTFSCMDSRGERGKLGTPGGDFAELATAIATYYHVTGINQIEPDDINDIFTAFMAKVITKERPFYFHTSAERLHKVFKHLEEVGHVATAPVVLPERAPADPALREAWIQALSMPQHQGCGHVRLMMEMYDGYGLQTSDIPRDLVKSFYRYFEERGKVAFRIAQGPQDGHAVAVVHSKGLCPGWSPAIPPSHGGAQVFVLHAQGVEEFRDKVIRPFFVWYAALKGRQLNQATFMRRLRDLHALALAETLTNLAPLNRVPIWGVAVETKNTGSRR